MQIKGIDEDLIKDKNKGKYLAIILTATHGSIWKYVTPKDFHFSIGGNTYFAHDEGVYHKGNTRFGVYLEGVSVPLHHGYIKTEIKEKTITETLTGKLKKFKIRVIKGLKFDSTVADILLGRGLASEFTKQHIDIPAIITIILLVIFIILQGVTIYGVFTA